MAAAMVSLRDLFVGKRDTAVALHHLTQALQLLKLRLSRNDAADDINIAIVTMMALVERHQNHYLNAKTHMDGLQRMVEIRGGISQLLTDNPVLSHKITRSVIPKSSKCSCKSL